MTKPHQAGNIRPGHPRAGDHRTPHLGKGQRRHAALALTEPPGPKQRGSERKSSPEPCPSETHRAPASPRLSGGRPPAPPAQSWAAWAWGLPPGERTVPCEHLYCLHGTSPYSRALNKSAWLSVPTAFCLQRWATPEVTALARAPPERGSQFGERRTRAQRTPRVVGAETRDVQGVTDPGASLWFSVKGGHTTRTLETDPATLLLNGRVFQLTCGPEAVSH